MWRQILFWIHSNSFTYIFSFPVHNVYKGKKDSQKQWSKWEEMSSWLTFLTCWGVFKITLYLPDIVFLNHKALLQKMYHPTHVKYLNKYTLGQVYKTQVFKSVVYSSALRYVSENLWIQKISEKKLNLAFLTHIIITFIRSHNAFITDLALLSAFT